MPIPPAIVWNDRQLEIIDQTLLPGDLRYISLPSRERVWEAIRMLRVRGAPAIGVCAAYGVVVGVAEAAPGDASGVRDAALATADYLATSRPTAVNLFWALDRMRGVARRVPDAAPVEDATRALEAEAIAIHDEDVALCRAIGEHGSRLIEPGAGVLTHCNAGALATGGTGTALSVFFSAHEQGLGFRVFADETRPLLQGARLTAWELLQAGIDVTLICDSVAATVMREGKVSLCLTGADRIAANGDAANKIGTYGVATLAHAHGIPFYVAAPYSTIDLSLPNGDAIPIEERDPREITHGFGRATAPDGVAVYAPAFDVTPASLIAGIITERGILRPPYTESISEAVEESMALSQTA